jgi:hypothetical protein
MLAPISLIYIKYTKDIVNVKLGLFVGQRQQAGLALDTLWVQDGMSRRQGLAAHDLCSC